MQPRSQPVTLPASVAPATVRPSGAAHAGFTWISAKLIIRSYAPDPDDIAGDIYSQMAEHIRSDEDIIDIEVNCVPLPADSRWIVTTLKKPGWSRAAALAIRSCWLGTTAAPIAAMNLGRSPTIDHVIPKAHGGTTMPQ
jgi:hypothetical protein